MFTWMGMLTYETETSSRRPRARRKLRNNDIMIYGEMELEDYC